MYSYEIVPVSADFGIYDMTGSVGTYYGYYKGVLTNDTDQNLSEWEISYEFVYPVSLVIADGADFIFLNNTLTFKGNSLPEGKRVYMTFVISGTAQAVAENDFMTFTGSSGISSGETTVPPEYPISGFTPEMADKFSGFMTIVIVAIVSVFIVFSIKTVYKFLRMIF